MPNIKEWSAARSGLADRNAWCSCVALGLLLFMVAFLPRIASAQESARTWTYASLAYDTQADAEAEMLANYSAYRYLKWIEVGEGQTLYHYWRGAAPTSETLWQYKNQGGATVYATEQEAYDALKVYYQALSNQRGCSSVTVVANGEWVRAAGLANGPSTQENRGYSATYSGCSYSPSGTTMFRNRQATCPASLSWNSAEAVCGGGATQTIASKPVACTSGCTKVKNPVDVANGEKYQPEPADFDLGWLRFSRLYQSGSATGFGAFGRGWSHNLAERLSISAGVPKGFVRGDGGEIGLKAFTGYWEANDGSGQRLTGSGPWTLSAQDSISVFDTKGRLTEKRFEDGTSLVYVYDNAYRLLSITHSTGRKVEFSYVDPSVSLDPHISSILLDGQALVSYTYTSGGMLDVVTFADGNTRQYHYEDTRFPWHLTGVSVAGTRYSTYTYDSRGRVSSSSLAGNVLTRNFTYPVTGGAVVTEQAGQGAALQTTYGITPDGTGIPYRQLSSTAFGGKTESSTYYATGVDFRRRLDTYIDRNGVSTKHTYSEALDSVSGEQVSTHNIREAVGLPEQRDTEIRTSLATDRVLFIKRDKREVRINRNARLQPTSVQVKDVPSGDTRITTYTYCESADVTAGTCPQVGLLKSIDASRTDVSDVTNFTYYQDDAPSCTLGAIRCPSRKGDLWKVTNAVGQVTEFLAYDSVGRPARIKDANGVVTDLEYNARGRLTARKVRGEDDVVETDDLITRIEYSTSDLVSRVVQPDGAYSNYTYDAAQRLTGISDNVGNSIVYTLDVAGNRTQEDTSGPGVGALTRTLSRTFNTLGQLQAVKDAYNHTTGFTYDDNGNPDQTTDALTRVTDENYDPLNRLSRSLRDMGGIAAETKYTYDAFDNVVQVKDPKLLDTAYTYNAFGDLKTLVSPDTGSESYTYDNAGNLASQTDARSKVANYTYDALNRLTGVSYPTASTLNVTYTWDTAQADCVAGETFTTGRLAKMVDGSGSTVYCYDRFGRVVRKVQTTGLRTLTLRYTWNAVGQLTSTIYPDGAVVDYVYDSLGRMIEIGAKTSTGTRQVLVTNVSYHPFGPASSWRYGSSTGRLLNRTLNQNYQPGIVQDAATGGLSVGYEFDEVGNLKKLRDGNQSEPPQRIYGYDGLDRLTQTQDGSTLSVLQGYTYDQTGNRTSTTVPSTTTYTYPGTSHRLSQVGTNARAYDFNGNTTSIPSGAIIRNFVYGDHNRMTQYLEGSTVKMNYLYNGQGERVRKYLASDDTYTMYDVGGHWIGDYQPQTGGLTVTVQQPIWFGDLPIGVFDGNGANQKLYYVEPDALGTPRVVIDPARGTNGTAVWKWDLNGEAFGATAPNQDSDGDGTAFVFDMRFPGQRYDSMTGLNYNYFRDYDPSTGRYTQSDPIGLGGGISTYAYAESKPLMATDPWGLAVYLCTRPVNVDWIPASLQPYLRHMWVRTSTLEAGMGGQCPIPGQGCADVPYTGTVTKSHKDQSKEPGATCVLQRNVDEDCVNRRITPGQPTGTWSMLNQCQSFSNGVVAACRYGPQEGPLVPNTLNQRGPLGAGFSPVPGK